jgi:hypothetical protein
MDGAISVARCVYQASCSQGRGMFTGTGGGDAEVHGQFPGGAGRVLPYCVQHCGAGAA